MSGETRTGRRVELYLSAEPQFGVEHQKQTVIDRLTELDRAGRIDDYDVHVWGREIRETGPLEGTDYHESILTSLREFEEWLDRRGAPVDRLFRRREVESEIVDESYSVISLPTMCLAVYDDDHLSGVYPYRDGEGIHTVRECLSELEETGPSVAIDGVTPGQPGRW